MNLDSLLNTLLANSRGTAPSDPVPYAFEQRVMARVRGIRPADPWAIWTAGLWRAALSSVAIAVLLVGANAVAPDVAAEGTAADELESAVVVSADPLAEPW